MFVLAFEEAFLFSAAKFKDRGLNVISICIYSYLNLLYLCFLFAEVQTDSRLKIEVVHCRITAPVICKSSKKSGMAADKS